MAEADWPAASTAAQRRKRRSMESLVPAIDTLPKSSKRRKVDWSAVDKVGGFSLTPLKHSKKRKTEPTARSSSDHSASPSSAEIVQENPFHEAVLSRTLHRVHPEQEYLALNHYRNFTIGDVKFGLGDFVYVKPDEAENLGKNAPVEDWVAKVLDIVGEKQSNGSEASSAHVFVRVCWLYRPEDLPGGRRPYHSESELIASNDMCIIDAFTVNGAASVVHWDEQPNRDQTLAPDQIFWRQSLDATKVGKAKRSALSMLQTHCIDKAPWNPNELLLQCSSCHQWLHGPCIERAAIATEYEKHGLTLPKGSVISKKNAPMAFSARLTSKDGKTSLVVNDKRLGARKSWEVPIQCLLCSAIIDDDAPDDNISSAGSERFSDPEIAVKKPAPQTPEKIEQEASDDNAPDSSSAARPSPSLDANGRPTNSLANLDRLLTDEAASPASSKLTHILGNAEAVRDVAATPASSTSNAGAARSGLNSIKRLLWGAK